MLQFFKDLMVFAYSFVDIFGENDIYVCRKKNFPNSLQKIKSQTKNKVNVLLYLNTSRVCSSLYPSLTMMKL